MYASVEIRSQRCGATVRVDELVVQSTKDPKVHRPMKIGEGASGSCIFIFVLDRLFRSRDDLVVIGQEINLARDLAGVGVTSVTGFRWIR